MTREDALFDIYRVMRPGEPPTLDTAQAMFQSLFFDPERYDLSAVGRVKMNMRLGMEAPDTQRTLREEDIVAIRSAAQTRFYSLKDPVVRAIIHALCDICAEKSA